MTPELKISIDSIYQTFSTYPGNPFMEGSPIYSDLDAWNRQLLSKELHNLTADDVSRFLGKAMTTWGNANDFKHFLPRMLELLTAYDTSLDIGTMFNKLEYANWNTWPGHEKKAIEQFMIVLWDDLLKTSSKDAEWIFAEYFSCLAGFYPDINELLKIWDSNTSLASTNHLANLIYNERAAIFDKGTIGRLQKKSDNMVILTRWLLSDSTVNRLEAAFYEFGDGPSAETISWAEKILSDERTNKH